MRNGRNEGVERFCFILYTCMISGCVKFYTETHRAFFLIWIVLHEIHRVRNFGPKFRTLHLLELQVMGLTAELKNKSKLKSKFKYEVLLALRVGAMVI